MIQIHVKFFYLNTPLILNLNISYISTVDFPQRLTSDKKMLFYSKLNVYLSF